MGESKATILTLQHHGTVLQDDAVPIHSKLRTKNSSKVSLAIAVLSPQASPSYLPRQILEHLYQALSMLGAQWCTNAGAHDTRTVSKNTEETSSDPGRSTNAPYLSLIHI